jgi:hypothetical protein
MRKRDEKALRKAQIKN